MKTSFGFTLVELVMVLAILAMIIIAVPAMGLRMNQQGVGLAVDQLRADIQLARLMAIKNKEQCAIVFHEPEREHYRNALSGKWQSLKHYRGGVHFLDQGPDGRPAASQIVFNRRGMSTSPPPKEVFLADGNSRNIFRVRVLLPGGISVHRWGKERWY